MDIHTNNTKSLRVFKTIIFHCLGYPAMAKYLNETGRPIMYSCEWAIYNRAKGVKVSPQVNHNGMKIKYTDIKIALDLK